MQELLIYGALALIAPYAIFAWFHRATHVVFEGEVDVSTVGLLPRMRSSVTSYDFLTVFMPDGSTMLLEASQERIKRLPSVFSKAFITVSQSMFGARYISSVKWPGDSAAEAGDSKFTGLYLSITYLMLAMLAACVVYQPVNAALLGHLGTGYVALLTVLSGWVLGFYQMKAVPADAETRFLGLFSLGKGRIGLLIAAFAAAILTSVCFYEGGLLVLVGLSTGVACGQLLALSLKPAARA